MQKQNSTIVLLCIHLSVCKNKSTYKTVNLLSDSDCERSESLNFKAGKKFWRYISSRRKDTINVSLMTNPSLQERTPPPSLLWCQPFSRLWLYKHHKICYWEASGAVESKESLRAWPHILPCVKRGLFPNSPLSLVHFFPWAFDLVRSHWTGRTPSGVCKTTKHILCKTILIHLEKFNIPIDCQHGFRQGRSYETQLVTTLPDIALNMGSSIQMDMLNIRFFKTFWCCPPSTLKLEYYGVRGNILSWISTWLTQRYQRVVVNGGTSSPFHFDVC